MKINCELPNDMLYEYNNILNDYDFILYHLYIKNEFYKKYFSNNDKNRIKILDNSAYELYNNGEIFNTQDYLECIDNIKPNYYIIPDILMDKKGTLIYFEEFNQYKINSIGIPVIQGNTFEELLECLYIYINNNYEYIAIPFNNSFFKDISKNADKNIINYFKSIYDNINDNILYAIGRVIFIQQIFNNILSKSSNKNLKFHLLGTHCPYEKHFYTNMPNIISMDSGYPVKLGIKNIKLGEELSKPDIIIDKFINDTLTNNTINIIKNNINKFKNIK